MLSLRGLSSRDTGEYVCQARNKIGTAEASIHLYVHYLPEVRPLTYRVYSGVGQATQLSCRVMGYPQPVVSWFFLTERGRQYEVRHDTMHTYSTDGDVHTLTISHLAHNQLTNFTCRAQNEVGFNQGHIEVTGIPQPPTINSDEKSLYATTYDLVFTVQSYEKPLKVKLKFWNQNQSALTNYSENSNEIYFTPGKLGHNSQSEEINRRPAVTNHVLSFRIINLKRSSTYNLLVSVRNSKGWSDQSNIFTFKTADSDYYSSPSFLDYYSSSKNLETEMLLNIFLMIYFLSESQ